MASKIVLDNPDLVRDSSTKAVINTNKTAYSQRLKQKQINEQQQSDLESLRSEMAEIKALLKELTCKDK